MKRPSTYLTRKAMKHESAGYIIDGRPVSKEEWVDYVESHPKQTICAFAKTTTRFIATTVKQNVE